MRPPGEASDELKLCDDLAAAHRLMAAYGLDEPGRGRLSARLGGWHTQFSSPRGRLWAAVTPWNLVRCPDDEPMDPLHAAIYEALPEAAFAIVQCHSPAVEAVSCLEEGLLFLSTASAGLHRHVAYSEWPAKAGDLADALEAVACPPARVLVLRGHGALAIGGSIGEAFVAMYDLNRSCALQLKAFGAGRPVRQPSESTLEHLSRLHEQDPALSAAQRWGAMRSWLGLSEHGDLPTLFRSNLA